MTSQPLHAPALFEELCSVTNALEYLTHTLALPEASPLRDALEALVERLDGIIDRTLDDGAKKDAACTTPSR